MIIGVHGLAQSGKDTAAWRLIKIIHSMNWKTEKFAKPVYEICSILSQTPVYEIENKKNEIIPGWDITYREMLIQIGMGGRKYNERIWIDHLFKRVDHNVVNLIITDVRFLNEVEEIKKSGGVVIKIDRDIDPIENDHGSESELLNFNEFDFIINNNGTLDELELKLNELWERHLKIKIQNLDRSFL